MTQKNKIWHTPKECLPKDCRTVVFMVPNTNPCVGNFWLFAGIFKDFYTDSEYATDTVNKWAYLSDLVSSSKALEVAIDALKYYRDYEYDKDCSVATDALKQIKKNKRINNERIITF